MLRSVALFSGTWVPQLQSPTYQSIAELVIQLPGVAHCLPARCGFCGFTVFGVAVRNPPARGLSQGSGTMGAFTSTGMSNWGHSWHDGCSLPAPMRAAGQEELRERQPTPLAIAFDQTGLELAIRLRSGGPAAAVVSSHSGRLLKIRSRRHQRSPIRSRQHLGRHPQLDGDGEPVRLRRGSLFSSAGCSWIAQ